MIKYLKQVVKVTRVGHALTWKRLLHVIHAKGVIESVAYSPGGQYVVSGSADDTVRIWNAQTGVQVGKPLSGHIGTVTSVAYSPDGQYVVSGSLDETVRIWNAQTIAYSPDGQYVVSGSDNDTVRIWNAQTGVQEYLAISELTCLAFLYLLPPIIVAFRDVGEPLSGHTSWVTSVAYSPDGQYVEYLAISELTCPAFLYLLPPIIVTFCDETVRIWNAQTGVQVGQPLSGHTDWVTSVAYLPDGQYVVSGSLDYTVRIWNAQTGVQIGGPLSGHTSNVTSVAYSPDGQYVVSGSYDRTVRIWNVQTGVQVGEPFKAHTSWVTSVAYSPDGQYVVSGSHDKTVRIWRTQTDLQVDPTHDHHLHLPPGVSSGYVDDHGWLKSKDEQLILWLPPFMRPGFKDKHQVLTVPANAQNYALSVDWSNFAHGTKWTQCWDSA
ncbi:hypothetical protein GYMLUDRAFT_248521 [Collybiopsis luxurians FD-317 M1]|uniref:WD40 repeat-like protein n=1 Tax=Collybiopsis luxurians FD-317 M1 TaxID=944289 RepID=A0A0D0CKP0_9AGAR|nr:hypothetical protein GYMLUDRAFT_248521 [Collybiopsis luxurians FD-317 M1]